MKQRFLIYPGLVLWGLGVNILTLVPTLATPTPTHLAVNPDPVTEGAIALTLQDLPPGFTEIPPSISEQLIAQFAVLRQQFGQEDVPVRDSFAFFHAAQLQAVTGFTGDLIAPAEQANFDRNLAQLQDPDVQAQIAADLQTRLSQMANVEIEGYEELPDLDNFADTATGFTLNLNIQGMPFQVDLISFRRDRVGAFTAILSRRGDSDVRILDLATTLDRKILAVLGQMP